MKPLFTVHAGEYLVGSYLQEHYPKWNVWVPAKDTGIDLLVTDAANRKTVSIQVKFSKDFNPTHRPLLIQSKLTATGWWTLEGKKVRASKADFWIFVLPSFLEDKTCYIIVTPQELLRRLKAVHGHERGRFDSYLWVTKKNKCWEARGLSSAEQELLAFDRFSDELRDFTAFLENWKQIETKLKK